MDWSVIFESIMNVIISIGIPLIFVWIRSKVKNETALKLITEAETLVVDCVGLIEQTYVIPLKRDGKWTAETARIAFADAKDEILSMMSAATVSAIETVHGDLDTWLKTKIESGVLYIHKDCY